MITARHLKPSAYRPQTWKNGRGQTLEIAVDGASPFRWRLSTAKLTESGPFSSYPSYDRHLVVMRGGPVGLQLRENTPQHLSPLRVIPFKGEWAVSATVSAAAEDFNVFTLRGHAKAGVYPTGFREGEEIQFPLAGQEHFIFCVDGSVEILETNGAEKFILEANDTFHATRASKEEFLNLRARPLSGAATCLWVVIHVTRP